MTRTVSASPLRFSTLLALTTLGIGLTQATPARAGAPSVVNLQANVLQTDGSYLWSYQVNAGSRPSLSHWLLGLDSSLLTNWNTLAKSVSEAYEIRTSPDPTTGATGIKFDLGYEDNTSRIVSFRLLQSYTTTLQTATFKSGGNVTTQKVNAPGVKTPAGGNANAVPEPSTLGLLAFAPLALGVVRRRRAR